MGRKLEGTKVEVRLPSDALADIDSSANRVGVSRAAYMRYVLVNGARPTCRDDVYPPIERRTIPLSTRVAVMVRDGATCAYCGSKDWPLEIDHVRPVVLGGSDDLDNLVVACRPCNQRKGATPLAT